MRFVYLYNYILIIWWRLRRGCVSKVFFTIFDNTYIQGDSLVIMSLTKFVMQPTLHLHLHIMYSVE
jgi:hypothetical protein